ncbi:MAG: hypothetical protein ACREYE_29645, partial [Gammaproteobacteria bacterium]
AGQIAVLSRTVLARILRLDRRTGISAKEDLTAPPQTCRKDTTYLSAALPPGVELIDYYHACDHLKDAFDAAYGENSKQSKAQFEKNRYILRDETEEVEKVIRALVHLHSTHPRTKKLTTELKYFRRRRHRMRYAEAQANALPIGSGVVEAACKSLAIERMRRSGMRWRHRGGQAILTFRAPHQSERFDRGLETTVGNLQTYRRDPGECRSLS